MTTGKTITLTRWTFVGKVMSLLFNMLSRLVITFLPRSKHLFISWLQSSSVVILEPKIRYRARELSLHLSQVVDKGVAIYLIESQKKSFRSFFGNLGSRGSHTAWGSCDHPLSLGRKGGRTPGQRHAGEKNMVYGGIWTLNEAGESGERLKSEKAGVRV